MAKFLSRMSLEKGEIRVKVDLIKVESAGLFNEEFMICFKRGPQ
jgi:hypothetical protein